MVWARGWVISALFSINFNPALQLCCVLYIKISDSKGFSARATTLGRRKSGTDAHPCEDSFIVRKEASVEPARLVI